MFGFGFLFSEAGIFPGFSFGPFIYAPGIGLRVVIPFIDGFGVAVTVQAFLELLGTLAIAIAATALAVAVGYAAVQLLIFTANVVDRALLAARDAISAGISFVSELLSGPPQYRPILRGAIVTQENAPANISGYAVTTDTEWTFGWLRRTGRTYMPMADNLRDTPNVFVPLRSEEQTWPEYIYSNLASFGLR